MQFLEHLNVKFTLCGEVEVKHSYSPWHWNAVELRYNVIGGTEIVSLYKSVAVSGVDGTSAEKSFETKYRPAGLLLKVNCKLSFKYEFKLIFRNTENYFYVF